MSLNHLNIIHLEERTDRLEQLVPMLLENEIHDYTLWPGVLNRTYPKLGILQAHKQIVAHAKAARAPYIHIAEDDLRFFKKGAWEYYQSKAAENADGLCDIFFSMIYAGAIENGQLASTCSGMTLYTIYEKFYDFFLDISELYGGVHVDRHITSFYEQFNFRVCDPFVCEQTGSRSDNTQTATNYRPLLFKRNLFGIDSSDHESGF